MEQREAYHLHNLASSPQIREIYKHSGIEV